MKLSHWVYICRMDAGKCIVGITSSFRLICKMLPSVVFLRKYMVSYDALSMMHQLQDISLEQQEQSIKDNEETTEYWICRIRFLAIEENL